MSTAVKNKSHEADSSPSKGTALENRQEKSKKIPSETNDLSTTGYDMDVNSSPITCPDEKDKAFLSEQAPEKVLLNILGTACQEDFTPIDTTKSTEQLVASGRISIVEDL